MSTRTASSPVGVRPSDTPCTPSILDSSALLRSTTPAIRDCGLCGGDGLKETPASSDALPGSTNFGFCSLSTRYRLQHQRGLKRQERGRLFRLLFLVAEGASRLPEAQFHGVGRHPSQARLERST